MLRRRSEASPSAVCGKRHLVRGDEDGKLQSGHAAAVNSHEVARTTSKKSYCRNGAENRPVACPSAACARGSIAEEGKSQ